MSYQKRTPHKKGVFLLLSFTVWATLVLRQENKTVLIVPANWNSELIPFPLKFVPEIDFIGFEDIRFAPGWSDSTSEEFWTYHFTWYIEKQGAMIQAILTKTFGLYYDGLAKAVLKEQSDRTAIGHLDKTQCSFIRTKEGFDGKIRVFDSFFTKNYIMLNVKVRETLCDQSNKQIISFDISPKHFSDEVWKLFQHIEIIEVCK
ncbi:MAG: hypothetical protein AAGB24_13245 [Bacteroidota bacterium]